MLSLLQRSIFVLLTITMAACTSVEDPPGSGGGGGTAGSGGSGAAAGSGGTGGTGGSTPAPTVTLSATPTAVATSSKTQLSWTATNADSCTASIGWMDDRLPGGGPEDQWVYEDTRYELTCEGPGGVGSDSADVSINTSQLLVSVDMDFYLVKAGDIFNVDVTVSNPGSVIVQNVIVILIIPQYVIINLPENATCTGACDAGEMIEWNIGSVGTGKVTVVSVESEVAQTVPDGEDIQFEVTTNADDEPPAVVTENTSEGESDLGLGLVQTPSQPEAGDVIVYTLSYDNSGVDTLANVELMLTLPGPVAFLSATDGGTVDEDGVVTWTFAELAPGASGDVEATVEVNPTIPPGAQLRAAAGASVDGTPIRARATTLGSVGDGSAECLFDEDCGPGEICDDGVCVPPLLASVAVNPDPVKPNELLYVAVTVSNPTSSQTVDDVKVDMTLPAGLKLVALAQRPGSTCTSVNCGPGQTVTWALGSLAPGESATVWITPDVLSSAASGTVLSFDASVSSANVATAVGSGATTVDDSRALGLRIAGSADPVRPGDNLTYTLQFANQGTQTLSSLDLNATLPDGTLFVSASDGGSAGAQRVDWTLGPLAPGEGGSRQFTVAVDQNLRLGSQLLATAQLQANGEPATSSTSTQVAATPLIASVQINPDPTRAGELFNVSVTVSNPSSSALANDVRVDVQLPDNLNLIGAAQRSAGSSCSSVNCGSGQVVNWQVGDIGPGESVVVLLEPTVASGAPDGALLVFQAEARASGEIPVRAVASTLVQGDRRLGIGSVASANPVRPGEELTYTLHLANQSSQTISSFDLSATVPDGATFVGASDGGAHSSGVVDWSVGPLGPGEGSTRTFTVAVGAGVPLGSQLRSQVEAIINGADADRARAVSQTQVAATPLIASIEVNSDPTKQGELFNVTVTVSNPDPSAIADDVQVDVRLPQGLNLIAAAQRSPGSSCSSVNCGAGQVVTWQVGSLPPGESVALLLEPTVATGTLDGALLGFDVQVYAAAQIPLLASGLTLVQSDRVLQIHSAESANPVRPAEDLTYTLHLANQSSQTVSGFDLSATVPEGATFVGASDGGLQSGGVVEWTVGPLGPGEGSTRTFTVAVGAGVPLGSQLGSQVEAIINGADADRARAVSQTQVAATPLIASIEVNPDPTKPGELFNVTVTVSNPDPSAIADDVQVDVRLPQGLNLIGASQRSAGSSCSSVNCGAGQVVSWQLGSLGPGESAVVSLEPVVASGTTDGNVVEFDAQIYAVSEIALFASGASLVQGDRILEVRSAEGLNPVQPGEDLTYTLHLANQSSQTVSGFDLRASVPEGATFGSASDSGSQSGGVVDWTVGPLAPGGSTTRSFTVAVDSSLALGSQLRSVVEAVINGADADRARAVTQTPVSVALLGSAATGSPDPVQAGQALMVSVTVTNPSQAVTLNDIQIDLQIPQGLNLISAGQRSPGSSCSSINCGARTTISWPVASLAPNTSVEVFIQPVVANGTDSGTLMLFDSQTTIGGLPITTAGTNIAVEPAP